MPTLMCTASRQCQVHCHAPASSHQVPADNLSDDRGGGDNRKENYEPGMLFTKKLNIQIKY